MPTPQDISFTDLANFQPKQKEAWYTLMKPECKYLLYGGAAHGGKSYFLRWAALGLGMYYFSKYGIKNVPIGLFSMDYPTLKDRQVIKIKHEIPAYLGSIKESRDEGYAFIGAPQYGSFIILLRNLDDPSRYRSAEFAAVLVEELTEDPETTFDDLRFRMRYKGVEDVKFIGTTNPGGVGHGFVKRKWVRVDPQWPDKEQDRFFFVQSIYSDNQYTTADYIRQLDALPEAKRLAYKEGDWDSFADKFFTTFREAVHTCAPFIPNTKQVVLVGGMDWGRTKPFSFHLAQVARIQLPDGVKFHRVMVFLEVYGVDKTPAEWWSVIKEKLTFYDLKPEDITWIQADPAMFTKGQDKSKSIKDQFVDANREFGMKLKPGSNDRIGGWTNYQTWLRIAPDDSPYYQVSTACPNLIRELGDAVHDKLKVEDVDTEGSDHALDENRYMLKKLKHIDAAVGRVNYPHPQQQKMLATAHFIAGKQQSINLDLWASPKQSGSSGVGAVRRG